MNLLIVESPAKASTIKKYLGNDFEVLASFGHIRDLPSKPGSVIPEEDFKMVYVKSEKSAKHITNILKAAKKAKEIYLATDPDREGESISWHVAELIKEDNKKLSNQNFKRVAFSEITKTAVTKAVANPRMLDINLINAQQARRALDYLVGFTLSPILWRKLPGCKSAGRVQSVALRLICQREAKIEMFKSEEYWDISAELSSSENKNFFAKLTHINDTKLHKLDIKSGELAQKIVDSLAQKQLVIKKIQKKQQKRQPYAPFITSSLQQEAARKLGFSAKKTMQIAQKLYEGVEVNGSSIGLITYMRTDGVNISDEAIENIRGLIFNKFGKRYLPEKARQYKSRAKNAQEAHEAIRPTDIYLTPDVISNQLEKDHYRLYELIWKRTLACQMENVIIDSTIVYISSDHNSNREFFSTEDVRLEEDASEQKNNKNQSDIEHSLKDSNHNNDLDNFDLQNSDFILKANGSTIVFDGFYKLYKESSDDDNNAQNEDISGNILPASLYENELLRTHKLLPAQHFTEAPARYSEASLVKKLEELGIGRPSTYAAILSVLQDRKYVVLYKKRFIPEELGVLLNTFLVGFFSKYVEYDFTANLENQLDEVASGELEWKVLLKNFWDGFNNNVKTISEKKISDIISYIEQELHYHLFRNYKKQVGGSIAQNTQDSTKPTKHITSCPCPTCNAGNLRLKLGKFGAFLGCDKYPVCDFRTAITNQSRVDDEGASSSHNTYAKEGLRNDDDKQTHEPTSTSYDILLGEDENKQSIYLKKGPYGFYVQLGDGASKKASKSGAKTEKPKRCSVPKNMDYKSVDLNTAIKLLNLPLQLGKAGEENLDISVSIGKYGPYIKYGTKFISIPKNYNFLEVDLKLALEIIEKASTKTNKTDNANDETKDNVKKATKKQSKQ